MPADRPNPSGEPSVVDSLILDLLEWLGPGPRPYRETMDAWRTSCPRLPVWEDATDLGFIERHHEPGRPAVVTGLGVRGRAPDAAPEGSTRLTVRASRRSRRRATLHED